MENEDFDPNKDFLFPPFFSNPEESEKFLKEMEDRFALMFLGRPVTHEEYILGSRLILSKSHLQNLITFMEQGFPYSLKPFIPEVLTNLEVSKDTLIPLFKEAILKIDAELVAHNCKTE